MLYTGLIKKLPDNGIYVFGANTEFRHGKGAAKKAVKFGAIYGKGGFQGKSYAIITKDLTKKVHPSISKDFIIEQIKELYKFALSKPELNFYIVYRGDAVNLNGYTPKEIASMFNCFNDVNKIPSNIVFEEKFFELMNNRGLFN
jgi:hypothetical protein